MVFYSFGVNHHRAAVKLRDVFAFSDQTLRKIYRNVNLSAGAEYILLSTCNRMECYLYGDEEDIAILKRVLAEEAGVEWPEDSAFLYRDEEAVMHIFEVAGGLDSMVIGDAQILGQIKDAYRVAVEEDIVSSVLHRLMHSAFGASKRIVNETRLTKGSSSVAGTAAAFAVRHLREEGGDGILIIGAGEMGRLVLDAVSRIPCVHLSLTNRGNERLSALLSTYENVQEVPWETRYDAVRKATVTIVTTASDAFVLNHQDLAGTASDKEHIIIDISMPRNVDPVIGSFGGYTVHNLDDLQTEIEKIVVLRESDLPPARAICEEMLADFVSWVFHHQAMQPAIQAILDTFDTIRQQEIERNRHRFSDLDARMLDRLTKSIMQKVLAVPVVRLKNVGPHNIDYVNGIKLLKTLFARETCEDELSAAEYDLSESILNALVADEEVHLSGLSACPFDEHSTVSVFSSRVTPGNAITLGTRGSALAMWQATHVQGRLQEAGVRVQLERITTRGDKILDRPFSQIEGKALFTKELDVALLDGRIDLAVHSLKDLPTQLPDGLAMAALSKRVQPRDVFVAHPSFKGALEELPEGAIIGTSSLRRTAQLKAWRPDLEIVPLRGNVDSRIKKLDESEWHGIVLAAAGLIRLGLDHRMHTLFDPTLMLPAPGQGALGIVCAAHNGPLLALLHGCLHDEESALAVRSERALLQALDGGCHVPVGALAERHDGDLVLQGFVGTLDGSRVIRDSIVVNEQAPEESGRLLAERMRDQGADEILEREKHHIKPTSS